MKRISFFKSLSRLLLLNVLVKPLWIFGVDRQVQNIVGHEAYGTYFSLLNLSLLFSFLTDAGISNMANRQLASGAAANVRQLLRLKLFLAAVYSVLVLITAWLTGAHQFGILVLVIGIQVVLSFFNFFRSVITAHQFFGLDVWLSVIDKGLMLLFFLPLLHGQLFQKSITILFFLQAQFLCTAIAAGIALVFIFKKGLLYTNAALQNIRAVLKSIAPYALIILAMSLHNRLDGFLLERLHPDGAYEAGVYAAAYRLLDASNMIGYLVASFLVPFIARQRTNILLIEQTVLTARYALLLFGIFTALFFGMFAVPAQQVLYPYSTPYTAKVLQWCIPVLPAYLLLHVYGSVLTAMAQLKSFLLLLAIAVVVNLVLNWLLIPRLGAVGCCIAALASQYGCAITVSVLAAWKNKFRHDGKQWIVLAATGLLVAGLFYAGRLYAVHAVLLAVAGGGLTMLALFAYLPFFKRTNLLSG